MASNLKSTPGWSAGIVAALAFSTLFPSWATAQDRCGAESTAVQVLGSGGPIAGTSRASTGYLLWLNGRAVIMVDAGGGTFLRFGQAGARLDDLSLLAISHLHPDHVADLPALLWVSELTRQKPLKIAGPSAGGVFPDLATFLNRLFDSKSGAFAILGGTLGQPGRGVRLDPSVVDVRAPAAVEVAADGEWKVTAIGVPHGDVPALAYRVQVGQRSIVFSSDQTGLDPKFVAFARDADLLIMHFAISTKAPAALAQVHATPATVGQVARDANVKRLVLSHVIEAPPQTPAPQREAFSGFRLDENVAEVKKSYAGPVTVATDMLCISFR